MFLGTKVIWLIKLYLLPVSSAKISCFKYNLMEWKLTFPLASALSFLLICWRLLLLVFNVSFSSFTTKLLQMILPTAPILIFLELRFNHTLPLCRNLPWLPHHCSKSQKSLIITSSILDSLSEPTISASWHSVLKPYFPAVLHGLPTVDPYALNHVSSFKRAERTASDAHGVGSVLGPEFFLYPWEGSDFDNLSIKWASVLQVFLRTAKSRCRGGGGDKKLHFDFPHEHQTHIKLK